MGKRETKDTSGKWTKKGHHDNTRIRKDGHSGGERATEGKGRSRESAANNPPKGNKDRSKVGEDTNTGADVERDVGSALRRMWRKEGRCLSCGSESHRIKDCSLRPKTEDKKGTTQSTKLNAASTSKPNAAKTSAKDATKPSKDRSHEKSQVDKSKGNFATPSAGPSERGSKRPRDKSPSGLTPSAKKGSNFSYASVTNRAIAMVILSKEGNHITVREQNRLKTLVEERWIDQLAKGEDLVAVERWEYTTRNATVYLADAASVETVKQEAAKLNLRLQSKAEY